jgi:hypothetical protein
MPLNSWLLGPGAAAGLAVHLRRRLSQHAGPVDHAALRDLRGDQLGQQQAPARIRAGEQHPHRADLAVVDHRQRGDRRGDRLADPGLRLPRHRELLRDRHPLVRLPPRHAVEQLDHHGEPRHDVDLVEHVGLVGRRDRQAQRVAKAGGEDEQPDLSMVYDREVGSMRVLLTSPYPRWSLLLAKLIAGV